MVIAMVIVMVILMVIVMVIVTAIVTVIVTVIVMVIVTVIVTVIAIQQRNSAPTRPNPTPRPHTPKLHTHPQAAKTSSCNVT